MIKKWGKFNESVRQFTYEMSQEIVYYFSENSKPSEEVWEFLISFPDTDERAITKIFDFYEAGPDDYKSSTKMLYDLGKSKPELTNHLIEVYNKIREERKDYPRISELDDILVDFTDMGFKLRFGTCKEYYDIRVEKTHATLDDFNQFLNMIESDLLRIQSDKISVNLYSGKLDYINIWKSYFIDARIIIHPSEESPEV